MRLVLASANPDKSKEIAAILTVADSNRPSRIERPMTSASSCSAALTICSGVWRNPV